MSRRASGLKAWLLQRITAVYLVLFLLYTGIWAMANQPITYPVWKAWIAHPVISLAILLFFLSLLLHAWVGVRNVLIDYIHPVSLRLLLLSLFAIGLIGSGLWVLEIVIRAQIL